MATLILGYYITKAAVKPITRKRHRWLGRISISLMAINIALGISMMAMVLAQ